MSRRNTVIALVCIEALVWLAASVIQVFPAGRVYFQNGFVAAIFELVSLALLFLPAILIGLVSRQWRPSH